jgi:hypothetical protein
VRMFTLKSGSLKETLEAPGRLQFKAGTPWKIGERGTYNANCLSGR